MDSVLPPGYFFSVRYLALLLLVLSLPVEAQVYRWVDARGAVHYSDEAPPPGVKAVTLNIDVKPGQPSPDTAECYTVRCQGERMEQRLSRREALEAHDAALRAAAAPRPFRGLEFRKYISIQRGMTEGELLGIAGEPDFQAHERYLRMYTYMPTVADPFTTTVTLTRGRVAEIDRARKF
jgi:hypothetical protein